MTKWSGHPTLETSILHAYIKSIQEAQHFIYIEQQFFITSCDETHRHENKKTSRNTVITAPLTKGAKIMGNAVKGSVKGVSKGVAQAFDKMTMPLSNAFKGGEDEEEEVRSSQSFRKESKHKNRGHKRNTMEIPFSKPSEAKISIVNKVGLHLYNR